MSLYLQILHREEAREGGRTMRNPCTREELLEEESVTALTGVAREQATHGACSPCESHHAIHVTALLHVTAT